MQAEESLEVDGHLSVNSLTGEMQVKPQIESPACSLLLLSFAEKLSGNFKVRGPIVGTSNSTNNFDRWIGLDCIWDCLVRPVSNCDESCRLSIQVSGVLELRCKGIGGQNEEFLYFLCSDHIGCVHY